VGCGTGETNYKDETPAANIRFKEITANKTLSRLLQSANKR
jgi:hypothetical protein